MNVNFKKRVFTSLCLLSLLYLTFLSNFIFGFVLIIISMLSLIEFNKIILRVFKKKILLKFLFNVSFIIYIFSLGFLIFIFLNFIHLKLLLFLIIITCVASDIGGYVFGKLFKGPKLTKISPNKTISGALGSVFFSSIIIIFFSFYFTDSFKIELLYIALITSAGCQLGDLFFSLLKRKASIKDTSNILPGHGGILDRIDGILLGVPIGFLSLLIIY